MCRIRLLRARLDGSVYDSALSRKRRERWQAGRRVGNVYTARLGLGKVEQSRCCSKK